MKYAILTLYDGKHVDEIIKDGRFSVVRKKLPIYAEVSQGYYNEQYISGYCNVVGMYYKNPETNKDFPFMLEEISTRAFEDIVTGIHISQKAIVKGVAVNRYAAINNYLSGSQYISCDANSIAQYLKEMNKNDMHIYKEKLQNLGDILVECYYESKRQEKEEQLAKERQFQKSMEDENYIRQFIKSRNKDN